ncbi:hypothetical protein chiPu_0003878 [Chiloscyllium punctatum]|uniref:Uncharacterized protein n=1 Tax=Chiloscyllium punctatum TaxID=137246 RepID=A0A401S512_CHIPU|nr:hypothetical protein [Chiloscyllium punctatum]
MHVDVCVCWRNLGAGFSPLGWDAARRLRPAGGAVTLGRLEFRKLPRFADVFPDGLRLIPAITKPDYDSDRVRIIPTLQPVF